MLNERLVAGRRSEVNEAHHDVDDENGNVAEGGAFGVPLERYNLREVRGRIGYTVVGIHDQRVLIQWYHYPAAHRPYG